MKILMLMLICVGAFAGDETTTAQALRYYCKACHGLGKYRFIYTDDDSELLQYIRTHKAPSGKRWVDSIRERLDWPSDSAPPSNQAFWMPVGEKRWEMAEDTNEGTPIRHLILETLSENPD